MSLVEFISKYNGQHVEVAGSTNAQFQCVDLANAYIKEVLGLPIIEWTNAVDFPSKAGDNYTWVANTPDGVPPAGSLVIFKKYGSLYGDPGHIGVCVEADVKNIKLFEQNYPTGSVCRIGTHNYLGCTGWLIPKVKPITDPKIDQLEKDLNNAHTQIDNLQTQVNGLVGEKKQLTLQIASLSSDLGAVRGQLADALKKIDSQNKIISSYVGEDAVQIETLKTFQKERDKYFNSVWELVRYIGDDLKVSTASLSLDEAITAVKTQYTAFSSSSNLANDKIKTLEDEIKRLNTHSLPVEKLSNKQLLFIIIGRLLKRS